MTAGRRSVFSVRDLAYRERESFARFLRELPAGDWRRPSLCAGWTVHDVVAHVLSFEELTTPAVLRRFGRHRFRLSDVNDAGVAEYRDWEPDRLIARMESHLDPRGLTTGFGCRVALLDAMIHQQDIRRALSRPREIPADRLIPALGFARFAPPIGAHRRVLGLSFRATDVAWSAGFGPEVRGPGEAIVMAVAGRTTALDELTGAGLDRLRRRC
ncbi:maleylpyruvate isomerase family mycothiol-dependent enzyme [Gordonia sp. (in: high G+C Gram-positive bacteria)]|uniref:maleylpyruvate isomerase family mycothiol-dependent enzyme n=1 Tax=Gordonia sp. (in: high G+C Gram-positive bacteria) TaxID=84139 RepID=UPI0035292CC6